jgi:transcriptional regulator with XRE-family HTH domain
MLGMSQDTLGKEIGVTFQQVQKYERGVNRVGSSRLYDFARILNVPVGYFFEDFSGENINYVDGFAEDEETSYQEEYLDSKETLALIRAYYKIKDTSIRRKVLALIKAMGPSGEADKED